MPKLLLTGFLPWGEHARNSASETVESLDVSQFEGWTVEKRTLPVSWLQTPSSISDCLSASPDVFIAFGQYKGESIRIETQARNKASTTQPDVNGQRYPDPKILSQAPSEIKTSLPSEELQTALAFKGIETTLSNDAGDYLCNFLFYHQMLASQQRPKPVSAGFIHLPLLSSWPLEKQIAAAQIIVETTLQSFKKAESK